MLSYPEDDRGRKTTKKESCEAPSRVPESDWKHTVELRWDNFLDAYQNYLTKKDVLTCKVLERKKIELELIDPSFQFNVK
jgi:hypothetical protein